MQNITLRGGGVQRGEMYRIRWRSQVKTRRFREFHRRREGSGAAHSAPRTARRPRPVPFRGATWQARGAGRRRSCGGCCCLRGGRPRARRTRRTKRSRRSRTWWRPRCWRLPGGIWRPPCPHAEPVRGSGRESGSAGLPGTEPLGDGTAGPAPAWRRRGACAGSRAAWAGLSGDC